MFILLALILSAEPAFSKITLMEDYVPSIIKNLNKKVSAKAIQVKKNSNELALLKKIHDQNEQINQYMKEQSFQPLIWDGSRRIETSKVFQGLLLNSVVSTNLESPLLVQVYRNQDLPIGTKFSCRGITNNKRVLAFCDRMMTPTKEIAVKVQLLNVDGSAGLRGEYNDGKDSYIVGAVASEFAKGVISASTSKIATPLGALNEVSEKNQILEGLANSANMSTGVILDEMKTKEPKVFIEAGKPVLIYFMEGLNAY